MAITLIGTASGRNSGGGNVTINFPAGLAQNDIILVMGGTGNSGTAAAVTTGGYTSLRTDARSNCDLNASWKRMGASPDSSVTCNGGGANEDGVAYVVMAFRGVDTSTAIDATTVMAEDDGTQPNSGPITTVTNGAALISCYIVELDDDTATEPSGAGGKVVTSQSETNPVGVGAAWAPIDTAGSINPGPWSGLSGVQSNTDWIAYTIALRPATAGVAHDGVLSAGAIRGTASFVGVQANISARFTMTASAGANVWVGTSLAIAGALSATGTGTAAFQGEGGGIGVLSITGEFAVSWVGEQEYMSSLREVITSKGALSVRVG